MVVSIKMGYQYVSNIVNNIAQLEIENWDWLFVYFLFFVCFYFVLFCFLLIILEMRFSAALECAACVSFTKL